MIITTIAGNIGKDAVYKSTQGGTDLCNFTVAATVGYGDKEQTVWFDVTKWGKGTDKLASYLTKGKQVTVSGELSTREYEGKTYLQLRAEHIKLQGGKDMGGGAGGHKPPADTGGFDSDLDDECPFASCDPRHERRVR
jgi:single-strand DNA-binding protein